MFNSSPNYAPTVFGGQPFLKPFLKPSRPFWAGSWNNLFWQVVDLKKIKKAQIVNFLTKQFFKNDKNQSRKGDSPEAP